MTPVPSVESSFRSVGSHGARSMVAEPESSVTGSFLAGESTRVADLHWSTVAGRAGSSLGLSPFGPSISTNSDRVRGFRRRALPSTPPYFRFGSPVQQTPPVAFLVFLGFFLGAAFFFLAITNPPA